MENRNLSNLNPVRAIYTVIGSICQDTELLKNTETQLKPEDFMQSLHKIVFKAINNIVFNASGDRVTNITAVDIDNYLSSYPTQYKVWNEQDGYNYIQNCLKHANKETFWQSYDLVKKMSVLRAYVEEGFDVSDLYDWESEDYLSKEKDIQELREMELKDIFEYFTLKNLRVKDDFNIETDIKSFKAGQNITELLDKTREGRGYGYPTSCGYENSAFGGLKKGKFLLRSGSTGSMKSSFQIRDMIDVAVGKIYKDGKWIDNGKSVPSLFISTELDEEDLNYMALSYLTGVNRNTIKFGLFNKEQRALLEEAGEILESSPFYLVHMPNYTITDMEDTIERHVLDYNVQYVAFDYIENKSSLQRNINELYGSVQREDQVLLYLSDKLKNIAEKYNISIQSATQLNRNGVGRDMQMNTNALRGGSAIADKVDVGMILHKAKESDLEKVQEIIEDSGFGNEPNMMRFLYKNREGIPEVIFFTYLDKSTIREECLFATDYDYNIIEDIEDLQYEFTEGKTEKDFEREKEYSENGVFGDVVGRNVDNSDIDF